MHRDLPLHLHISTLFFALIVLVGGLIGAAAYKLTYDALALTAETLTQRISRETTGELERLFAPAEMTLSLLAQSDLPVARTLDERMKHLPFIREVLNHSEALSSVYAGYGNGDFFLVRRVLTPTDRTPFKAPENTRFVVQSIEHRSTGSRGQYIFLDADLRTLRTENRPDYPSGFDPRKRPWYQQATASSDLITTPPYLFYSTLKVGATLAQRGLNNGVSTSSVVGGDILLETLGAHLARQKITPGTQMALVNAEGLVLAHENVAQMVHLPDTRHGKPTLARLEHFGVPVLARVASLLNDSAPADLNRLNLEVADADWRVNIETLARKNAPPLTLIIAIPDRELLASALRVRNVAGLILLAILLVAIPLAWWIARSLSRSLGALVQEAIAISHFEFNDRIVAESMVTEVRQLGETIYSMKRTIRRFLDINREIAAQDNFERLLPTLLDETISAAKAKGGILYLADAEGLIPMVALTATGQPLPGGEPGSLLPLGLPSLQQEAHELIGPLLGEAIERQKVWSAPLQAADIAAIGLEDVMAAAQPGQKPSHAMAVPLINRQHHLVGAMLLLGDDCDEGRAAFISALSGSVAVTLESRELIKSQKDLFEAFIQLLASAIDAKSPYTGGHCARVPELTKMLARAACAAQTGPFKDFSLDESEWEAVHVASWLHDCGKITTPEYVVDKATKLETIYDRIHEVRMRFEVLKRDAEIVCLKAMLAGGDPHTAQATLAETLQALNDDFAFVATCNEGGEFMAPEKVERLKGIATRTWVRTLDDRIGIAHEEKERKARTPAPVLPVEEPLLANRPEHLFERRPQDRIPERNKWGFRMPAPELLYNKGELYNLSVARGTLAEEERYKINEHIVQTEIMLTALPFPKHLRNVPEIACGHHEKMNGTGYPKRLSKEQMSPVARMMAIADIFEALTAVDRPYKKGKTLSEAVKIMSFMKKDQHIDPELFELFLRSGVYREYAARFMRPEQMDDVNIEAFL